MNKLRLLPPIVTFGAGAVASALLYLFQIDLSWMLLVLLIVLVVFYVIGVIAMKILMDCRPDEKAETIEISEETDVDAKETSEEVKG